MRYPLILSFTAALAACGADGLPVTPSMSLGLKFGPNGVTPTINAAAQSGPVTISVGNE